MKEKLENGPLTVRAYMVYLNVESDMDNVIDPVAGSPTRNRMVNINVCMHVDDLIFSATADICRRSQESSRSRVRLARWTRMVSCSAAKES